MNWVEKWEYEYEYLYIYACAFPKDQVNDWDEIGTPHRSWPVIMDQFISLRLSYYTVYTFLFFFLCDCTIYFGLLIF